MTLSRAFLPIAATLSLLIALASYRFIGLGPAVAFPDMIPHIDATRAAFLAHVIAAPIALALGAFQFMPRLRARRPGLHRASGRLYGAAILVAGLGALGMAANANGGLLSSVGFALLAILWIGTTANAIRLAIARDIPAHRRWMIRSFALTFAAVTLRLELAVMVVSGMTYLEAIPILAWLCWVPNLLVAELILRRTPLPHLTPNTSG